MRALIPSLRQLCLAWCLILGLAACSREPEPFRQESYVFGTRVEVTVLGEPEAKAQAAVAQALAELDRLHERLHAWKGDGELVRINRALAQGEPAPLAPDLAELLRSAQRAEALSDGLFSPALGGLVALWGFHADSFAPVTPDPAALRQLVEARPRLADLTLADGRLASHNRAVQLDLGGIAKGWALDRVRSQLKAAGIRAALVNIGGNVIALGQKSDGTAWKVGIQHPRRSEAMAVVELADGEAVGTSGDYQRYFELDGQRHCHLIDPRDGSSDCRAQAATVVVAPAADAGLRSDVATKPIYLADTARASYYASRFGIRDVLLVDGHGEVWLSRSMQARLHWLGEPPRIHLLGAA
ncbi:FAD:protein FMN transferase [Pseudogulbenkiania sp. MAI-1]|uniref:FAD:protein FMN transferase n=1 Tax=Pseudogulbenkiania sp. MAI-1 TaxID=990370 RepID=UPI00045E97C7|nr:FAD:protein FMN transferase [Pseudogulbenkiania sp. MAI-1]